MISRPRILIAPLDWGLGHASRCIPIVNKILRMDAEPVFAGDGLSLKLLKKEFPDFEFVALPNYKISYPTQGSIDNHFLMQTLPLLKFYRKERAMLNEIILQHHIDAVISDNRYGLYHPSIPCVLITHQLRLQLSFPYNLINFFIPRLIHNFDSCWVPDIRYHGLAGELSADNNSNFPDLRYIGALSRFSKGNPEAVPGYLFLAIISGPSPLREDFIFKIIDQFNSLSGKQMIITGSPDVSAFQQEAANHVELRSMVNADEIVRAADNAKYLLARSGYSTIMDLTALGRNGLLVPTPGQAEQEYLASYHQNTGKFVIQNENKLDLIAAMQILDQRPNISDKILNDAALEDAIKNLLHLINQAPALGFSV